MKKFFTIMVAAFAAVSAFAQSRTTLWEGEQVMDGSWPNVGVELSNLATAKAGDNIVVTTSKVDASINASWEWGSQVFLKVNSGANGDWEDMAGTSAVGFKEPGEAKFEITDKILEQFKTASSFFVQGMCVVVSKFLQLLLSFGVVNAYWAIGLMVSAFLLSSLPMLLLVMSWSLFIPSILRLQRSGGSLRLSLLVLKMP